MKFSPLPFFASVVALLLGAGALQAQGISIRGAAGAAVPVSGAGALRDAGPAALLSLESQLSRGWSLRIDAEWSVLTGPPAPAGREHFSNYGDLRIYGASLNGILRFSEDETTPYLLGGIGAYRLQQSEGDPSPYGITAGMQAGAGIDASIWRRANPFVEARVLVHLTDYGSHELTPTVYWPVLVGLRIR